MCSPYFKADVTVCRLKKYVHVLQAWVYLIYRFYTQPPSYSEIQGMASLSIHWKYCVHIVLLVFRTHSCLWPFRNSFLSYWAASSTVTINKVAWSELAKTACMGNNFITKIMHKPCIARHCTDDKIFQALSLFYVQHAAITMEEPGSKAMLVVVNSFCLEPLSWAKLKW